MAQHESTKHIYGWKISIYEVPGPIYEDSDLIYEWHKDTYGNTAPIYDKECSIYVCLRTIYVTYTNHIWPASYDGSVSCKSRALMRERDVTSLVCLQGK